MGSRRKLLFIFILLLGCSSIGFTQDEDEELEGGDEGSLNQTPAPKPSPGAVDPYAGAVGRTLQVADSSTERTKSAGGQSLPIDPGTASSLKSAANPEGQDKLRNLGIDEGAQAYRRDLLDKINSGDRKGAGEVLAQARERYPDDPTFVSLEKLTKNRMTKARLDRIIAKALKEGQQLFGFQVTYEPTAVVRPGSRFFGRDILTRAYAQINKKNDPAAEKILTSAIARDPGHAIFYETRGEVRQRRGDLKGADADSLMAIKLNPNDSNVYSNRAALLYQMGRKEESFKWITRALQLDPLNEDAVLRRGLHYYENNQIDLALADYKLAAKINPKNYDLYRDTLADRKGVLVVAQHKKAAELLERGDYAGAIAAADEAVAMMPSSVKSRNVKVMALLVQGKYNDVVKEATLSIKANPINVPALMARAAALEKLGDKARADDDRRKAAAIDPSVAKLDASRQKQ